MQKQWLRYGLIAFGTVLALWIAFSAGIFVGRFGRLDGRGTTQFIFRPFNGAHGAVGTIQNIEGQTITMQLRDGTTQGILVDSQTRIERNRQNSLLGNLKAGDQVLVIGSPNAQGQITARWIRVVDPNTPSVLPWDIFHRR
jgi:preprotein translocase subunit YajC